MQNLVNEAPAKKNYEFIDVIRGIAMISIVAEHSVTAGGYEFAYGSDKYWINLILIQLTKFGTIAFFLLAGFLIGEKFADYSPGEYLKRRISTTFGPWLFWTLVYMVAMIITMRIKARIYNDGSFTVANILDQVQILYLHTSYWFIINFLISISILLMFRKYLYSYYLGGSLLLFTLFYVVNIHYEWVDPRHSCVKTGMLLKN
jgi:surface polysaccharide O-acyltransferase-like enzyme